MVKQEIKLIEIFDETPLFSNDYMDMWICEGVLVGRYKNNIIIDKRAAKAIWRDREALCGNKSYPAIWDSRTVKYWTAEGRKFQSTDLNYRFMKATCAIFDYSYPAIIIINFFLKIYKPPVPVKFFTDPEEAFKWIRQFS